jgi:hypothetical protein
MKNPEKAASDGVALARGLLQTCCEMELPLGYLSEVKKYLSEHDEWSEEDEWDLKTVMKYL